MDVKLCAVALAATLSLGCVGMLAGCNSNSGGTVKAVSLDETIKAEEKRIEAIRNDSHLPQNVKDMQIGAIQANLQRIKQAQAGGKSAGP